MFSEILKDEPFLRIIVLEKDNRRAWCSCFVLPKNIVKLFPENIVSTVKIALMITGI